MNFVSLRGHHDRFALTLSGPDELVYRFWFSIYVSVGIFTAFALPLVVLRNGFLIHDAPTYLDGRIGESELRDRIIYLPFYLIAPVAVFLPIGVCL